MRQDSVGDEMKLIEKVDEGWDRVRDEWNGEKNGIGYCRG